MLSASVRLYRKLRRVGLLARNDDILIRPDGTMFYFPAGEGVSQAQALVRCYSSVKNQHPPQDCCLYTDGGGIVVEGSLNDDGSVTLNVKEAV